MSLWLALPWAGARAAAPRAGEELTVLGFNGDGRLFAVVIAGPGEPEGTLRLWDAATGRPVDRTFPGVALGADRSPELPAELLEELGLGGDPGTESYSSGTPLATRFVSGGAPMRVAIVSSPIAKAPGRTTAVVSVSRGNCGQEIPTGVRGRDLNLVNVLESKDRGSLAVVFKYTDGALRRYGVAAARLADGPLAQAGCLDGKAAAQAAPAAPDSKAGAAPAAKCLERLSALAGSYTGLERIKDSTAGAEVPLYLLTIEARGGRPAVSLFENPAVGAVACGVVVGCQLRKGELLVTTHETSGRCDDGSLRILPRPDGALEIEFHGFMETYRRD